MTGCAASEPPPFTQQEGAEHCEQEGSRSRSRRSRSWVGLWALWGGGELEQEQEQTGAELERQTLYGGWTVWSCMNCMESELSTTNFVHPFLLISMHFYPFLLISMHFYQCLLISYFYHPSIFAYFQAILYISIQHIRHWNWLALTLIGIGTELISDPTIH